MGRPAFAGAHHRREPPSAYGVPSSMWGPLLDEGHPGSAGHRRTVSTVIPNARNLESRGALRGCHDDARSPHHVVFASMTRGPSRPCVLLFLAPVHRRRSRWHEACDLLALFLLFSYGFFNASMYEWGQSRDRLYLVTRQGTLLPQFFTFCSRAETSSFWSHPGSGHKEQNLL
jgi:hypothetical protein